MSINRKINCENLQNVILLSNKKAKVWVNLKNTLGEKSQTLEHILYDSIYMKINNRQN